MATNRDIASFSEGSVDLPTYTEESSCSDNILSTTIAMSHSSLEVFEPEDEREYDGSKNVTKATSTDHETTHESNLLDEVASDDRPTESVVAASGRSLPAEEMLHERINQGEQGWAQTDDVWATEHRVPRTWHEHEEILDEQGYEQAEEGQDQLDAEPGHQGMAGLRATEKHQCIICWESVGDLPDDNYVQLHCGDIYCRDCINAALELSIRCEANFPLHCACKQPLPIEEIYHLLAEKLLDRYFAVLPEWTSVHRTYCAKCLHYIDSKEFREDERYSTCTSCIEETCRECKASKSDHETGCPPDTDRQKLLQLSTSEGWKQCSSCGNLIEKDLGCDHMT